MTGQRHKECIRGALSLLTVGMAVLSRRDLPGRFLAYLLGFNQKLSSSCLVTGQQKVNCKNLADHQNYLESFVKI